MRALGSTEPDLAVGEFAKTPTPNKMYHDKLKSVLVTKKHLNSIIKNSKSITAIPFLLIMGFTISFLEMHFDNNQGYTIYTIASCSFPITKNMLDENGIENIINAVEAIKRRVNGIKDKTEDCQRQRVIEKMSTIMESPSNINKPFYAISPVIWPNKTNVESLDDEEYDYENEDGEEYGYDNEDDEENGLVDYSSDEDEEDACEDDSD